jgi:hypothetical protein
VHGYLDHLLLPVAEAIKTSKSKLRRRGAEPDWMWKLGSTIDGHWDSNHQNTSDSEARNKRRSIPVRNKTSKVNVTVDSTSDSESSDNDHDTAPTELPHVGTSDDDWPNKMA